MKICIPAIEIEREKFVVELRLLSVRRTVYVTADCSIKAPLCKGDGRASGRTEEHQAERKRMRQSGIA